jgi:hypothetical protein
LSLFSFAGAVSFIKAPLAAVGASSLATGAQWFGKRPGSPKVNWQRVGEVPTNELPVSITDDPDWPLNESNGVTFVVPRDAVSFVWQGLWGSFRFEVDGVRFGANVESKDADAVRAFLVEHEWPLQQKPNT